MLFVLFVYISEKIVAPPSVILRHVETEILSPFYLPSSMLSKFISLFFPLYDTYLSPGPFSWFCLQFVDICLAGKTPKLETVMHRGG